jgi:hypothetical protein
MSEGIKTKDGYQMPATINVANDEGHDPDQTLNWRRNRLTSQV